MPQKTLSDHLHGWSGALLFPALCVLSGSISALVSNSGPNPWYQSLEKSPLNPPSWAFGVVWPILFILMGLAAWLVYRSQRPGRSRALALFVVQLAVNFGWSVTFFGLHLLGAAFVHIGVLWLLIMATMITFWRFSRLATILLVPYLAWVSFASHLAYEIWARN